MPPSTRTIIPQSTNAELYSTCTNIPRSADASMYSCHNSSQYRCLGVLASSFHGVLMPRMYLSHNCSQNTDVKLYLHYHFLECRCLGVLIPSFPRMQMPRCFWSIILDCWCRSVFAPSFPEGRCHCSLSPSFLKVQMPSCAVLASSFPGVQMPRRTRAIIPHITDALVYLHHHSPECRCHEYSRHNSSQYRCFGVFASSFPGVQMPWSTRVIIPHSTDALVSLHYHRSEWKCHGVHASDALVHLHHHCPECRCYRILASSFPGVKMPECILVP